MEQSTSGEANRFPASQEIAHILRNPRLIYRIVKNPPSVYTLNQLNSVHAASHLLKIHFNIILLSTSGFYK